MPGEGAVVMYTRIVPSHHPELGWVDLHLEFLNRPSVHQIVEACDAELARIEADPVAAIIAIRCESIIPEAER